MEAGGLFEVEYTSPLERARRAEEGVSILRTFEQLAPLAQIGGPAVFRRFNFDVAAKVLADVNGVPSKILYTDEQLEEIKAQEEMQNQMAQVLDAAPVAARAAKDLAGAQALANAQPNEQMPIA